ncbi:MAG: hypothetical protein MI861_27380 [Pirellulales bacterium]|nr:hypothetical protein [Pirellulales bacterium]
MSQYTQSDRLESDEHESIIRGVEFNTQLLEQMLEQLGQLRQQVAGNEHDSAVEGENRFEESFDEERQELREQIGRLQDRVEDLEQQNQDLASQLASSNVRETVAGTNSGSSDAMSWEDRKQLILQQMEDDSFDAESFVNDLRVTTSQTPEEEPVDPIHFVQSLMSDLERSREDLQRREEEIGELRCLLDQQSETREDGTAIGAAAIASMIDTDELVRQERERLQLLQEEWEEKFRQGEIEASLERAKLSRERLELARKNSELEEQLEHVRREARQAEENSSSSRRWRAKLGLTDD